MAEGKLGKSVNKRKCEPCLRVAWLGCFWLGHQVVISCAEWNSLITDNLRTTDNLGELSLMAVGPVAPGRLLPDKTLYCNVTFYG